MVLRIPASAALVCLLSSLPAAAQDAIGLRGLPLSTGRVAQYSLTPRGDVDGLLLDDGTEIHLPPHLGPQLVAAVKPGDAVAVRGVRARAIPMVQAVSVTNQGSGRTVFDDPAGPGAPPSPPLAGAAHPMTVTGTIRSQLHGPKGDLNGVVLTDGTIVRLPPGDAGRLGAALQPGAPLAADGIGLSGPLGRVVAATRIGAAPSQMTPLSDGPPRAPDRERRP